MRYLSLFSGIEAASVAWEPLGWTPVAFAEVDPFARALLAHRFPAVPNLGDVSAITDAQIAAIGPIDVVVGGSPCQDLSVAGKRAGLAGARSSLFHEQVRIFHAARTLCGARWLIWENVHGAFSSHGGRDFAVVVGTLAGCGLSVPDAGWGSEGVAVGQYGLVEWSVLDAQWFGLAQRRRRVFAVLDTGDWANRPPVLLEPESLRGDSAPRRETREDVAPSLAARTRGGGGLGTDAELDGALVAHSLRADGFDASEDGTGRGTPLVPAVALCLNAGGMGRIDGESETMIPVAFDPQGGGKQTTLGANAHATGALGTTETPGVIVRSEGGLDASTPQGDASALLRRVRGEGQSARGGAQVRRLTVEECEFLQGFPRGYTNILVRGKPAADGPRYKALGNSMAVPCMTWIGRQIAQAHVYEAARVVRGSRY